MGNHGWAPGERTRLAFLAAASVSAVLFPLRQHLRAPSDRVDGFPLSYYPMFSKRRRKNTKIVYVVCVHSDGLRHPLPHEVLGSGGFNQVRHQLNRLVRQDRAQIFATTLAARLDRKPGCRDAVRVEVVRGTFDLDACMVNRRVCGSSETVVATADLSQTAAAA